MRPFLLLLLAAFLTINHTATAQTLFFSEYVEGSSFNKAVEIYNPTSSNVDLSAYTLELYSNGSAAASQTLALSGTLAPGDVFVAAHPSADAALLAEADVTSGSVVNFNGDDAIALRLAGALVDVIGQIGVDPGTRWGSGAVTTQDNTLRRMASVCMGDTDGSDAFDPAEEYEGFANNTFDGIGSHTGCTSAARTPFFSEYVEGSSNNKAVEIYNPTGGAIDLAAEGYRVEVFFNGSTVSGLAVNLTGTLAAGGVFVVASSSASAPVLAAADQTQGGGWFNGDDAVVLLRGADTLDVIGQVGFDPGSQWGSGLASTADNTLRRMASVCAGDTNPGDAFDPAAEYDGYAQDTFDGLGTHVATCTGGSTNAAPVFTAALADQSVAPGAPFTFDYDASDTDDGDVVTYSLLQGPVGSTLDVATGVFAWTPTAAQAGQSFVVRVGASDGTATTTTEATLTVNATVGDAPVFTATFSGTIVPAGQTVTFDYDAFDPDGGSVVYSLVRPPGGSIPAGSAIDPATGIVTFTPATPGAYALTVRATDDETASTTTTAYVGATGVLFPGLSGAALRASLRASYTPTRTLGYDTARDTMYFEIDRGASPDGDSTDVCGVYTGFCVSLPAGDGASGGVDPSSYLFSNGINAEHTWPQSKGASQEPQRSDMHNLFPAKDNVNSSRGNKPYGEIPDAETTTWYKGAQSQTTIPTSDIGAWSETISGVFEPREVHKGNAARASLYFYAVYESVSDMTFLFDQLDDLAYWNGLDTADVAEVRRTYLISLRQGNVNPFVIDGTLARRAYADYLAPTLDCTDPATAPSYAGGYVLNSAGTRAFVRVSVPVGGTSFEFYNTRNLVVGDPEADVESGSVLTATRTGAPAGGAGSVTFAFSPASPQEVYFPITAATSATGVAFYLRATDACNREVDVDPSFALTGVEPGEVLAFGLEASVPNPVRTRAEIGYALEKAGEVTLVLYDVLGREVAVLDAGQRSAGIYTASVDATSLAPGVYVYRLTAGGRTLTRTLTVAR